ncbi:hypothetical protein [Catenuloplanes indicus]|uniref:Uncharacterized protein n=1 Tax=Catenuloplanes indicus TaxID=137267 RepID=A0AAE3VUQ9_9ACTN|nr:hypothetical protein [Catenuloplanes indicus]MDQ0363415.1 hypothetical protein [Catenuloplanes indicus]
MNVSPDRIGHDHHVNAACALNTVPLLAARVTALLWWGRRITVVRRWLDRDSTPDLKVGLTVDHQQGDRAVRANTGDDFAGFGVHLAPGIEGFGFNAYGSDGSRTEAEVWKRWHAGDRREITLVELSGGGDNGPGLNDSLTITRYNQHRVGEQIQIGFDHHAYSAVWQERSDRGWQLGGESLDISYCDAWAQHGPYRVRCGFPLAGDACAGGDDHIDRTAPVVVSV